MPVALFGIENEGLNLAVNLLVLFLVVVWIALVVWTFLDARRRLDDPVLIGSATVASLFPFVGTVVYSILRPPEFKDDRHERELEIRAAELRVRQLEEASCPNCGFPIERSYLRCPSCRARVKDPCSNCGKPIDPRWSVCPYCESALRAPPRRGASTARPAPEGRPGRRPAPRQPQRPPARSGSAAGAAPAGPRSSQAAPPARSQSSRSGEQRQAKGRTPTKKGQAPPRTRPRTSPSDDGNGPAPG